MSIVLSLHYVRSMEICPGYVCLYCCVHVEVLQWVDFLPKNSFQKPKKIGSSEIDPGLAQPH